MKDNAKKQKIKKAKKEQKNAKKKPEGVIKNPAHTLFGKIIVVVLAVAMAAGSLATLIYIIIENSSKV